MPAMDTYHHAVKHALIKDGWTITHDPYTLTFGLTSVYVDVGAERTIAAEKGNERIAVETKSFRGTSDIRELEMAIGQYVFYRSLLKRFEPGRKLYLAVPESTYLTTLTEPIARPPLEDTEMTLLVYEPQREVILRWIH
jgi:hypothetical protein